MNLKFSFFFILITFLTTNLLGQNCSPGDPGYVNIDFETDGNGNALGVGAVIDENTYSNFGIEMSVSNVTGTHPLVIFDSSNPTGGDCDLGTPSFNCATNTTDTSNDCAGTYPGQSNSGDGQNNCVALGNIVIISENYPFSTVGAPDPDPDDLASGGTITLNFNNPYTVSEIGLVDDAEGNFFVTFADGSTQSIPFNGGGDNDVSTFFLGLTDVVQIDINFNASGGFSNFVLCDQNTATVGDQLYIDVDGDGSYNPTIDTPISGVEVNLTLPDGSIITTETDASGNYLFENLTDGAHSVSVNTNDPDFPAGLENSVDPDGAANNSSSFTLSDGENNLSQDFGYQGTATIGDQLFVDENGDGMYTPGVDTPIANVTVTLINSNGEEVTTTTNENGEYLFENLLPDTYTIVVDTDDADFPDSVIPSVDADGVNTPNETMITITAGSNTDSIDFGYEPLGSIGDQLFVDEDGDGAYNPIIDTPIANVTVTLTNPNGSTTTATTDAAGNYLFTDLPAGDYTVTVDTADSDFPADVNNTVDPDGANDSTSDLTLGTGEDNLDQDFGYEPLGSIGDQLFVDEDGDGAYNPSIDTPIANVTITLTNPNGSTTTATTDAAGNYLFTDLPAGDYTLTVDTADSDFPADVNNTVDPDGANDSTSDLTLGTGEDNLDQDFGYEPLGSIGDQLFVDEDGDGAYNPSIDTPIANVTVTLTNPDGSTTTAITDAAGNYLFTDLPAGDYTVTVDTADSDFPADVNNTVDPDGANDSTSDLTLGTGEDNLDQDFGYEPLGSISGNVSEDTDNDDVADAPIAGVTITLLDENGAVVATDVTDALGNYEFLGLEAGEYTVTEQDETEINANYADVFDGDETSEDADDAVDALNDDSIEVTLTAGESDNDNNFVEELLGTISGNVSEDTDNDDVADAPIAGVTITLLDENGAVVATDVTDALGNYEFTGLEAGEYTVTEQDETEINANYTDVFDGDETSEDADDAVDALNDDSIEVTLTAGEDDDDNNFVEELLGTISGNVSEDTNNDDVADAPIAGVTITLLDENGAIVATDVTDASGNYEFTGLEAGEYTVTEQDETEINANYSDVFDGDETSEDADDAVDTLNDDSIEVTLTAGESDDDDNFVEELLGSIGDQLFVDEDDDGANDPAIDTPIANVTVTLTNSDGSTTSTETDEMGVYLFTSLPAGDYTITVDTNDEDFPAYVINTTDPEGDNNSISSITLGNGENDMDRDFGYIGSALPVTYLIISAAEHREGAIVEWATVTEINADRFEVLKSTDGNNFTKIGEVNASNNSENEIYYSFIDNEAKGAVYYRLNQIDLDGSAELSLIVSVQLKEEVEINVYPNPTADIITIQLGTQATNSTIRLINIGSGIIVKSMTTTHNIARIEMYDLPGGHYIIEVLNNETNTRMTKKITKI